MSSLNLSRIANSIWAYPTASLVPSAEVGLALGGWIDCGMLYSFLQDIIQFDCMSRISPLH